MTMADTTTPETPGGEPQEPVENRPGVGKVKPEDYPPDMRERTDGNGERDEEDETERLNPGYMKD